MSTSANIALILDGPSHHAPDVPAFVVGERSALTFRQLADQVSRRAAGFRNAGLAPGQRVAFYAGNSQAYLELMLAVWHAGGVVVPLSSRLHLEEMRQLLAASHARAVVTDQADLAGEASCSPLVIGSAQERRLAESQPIAPVKRSSSDDAWIFYTSGTTGQPKGARLSHGNLFAMVTAYLVDVGPVHPGDRLIHVAAMSHASGLFALPLLSMGGTQVLPASGGFDIDELVELIENGQRSSFFVPPVLLRRLCLSGRVTARTAKRTGTVLVGAAPVLPSDLQLGVGAFGRRVWNGYGQGESPCTITAMSCADVAAHLDDPARLASVGTARFATRVRVVDAEDHELPAGELGEVVVDGPTVMSGYLDRAVETANALRHGWLHTGDIGAFDDAGYLTLVDRAKDLIISGGDNIYPRQVEDVLLADPSVEDAAVVGVPDDECGERVVAYVVGAPGTRPDPRSLDARCLAKLARYKRPREYKLVSVLPRNAAGKVLKPVLRDGLVDAVDLMA
jgi:long-chain acyl-CoA synthetase